MNDLNDTLPDLLRRATNNLEPESTDLGARGRRRGLALRRRRTALRSLTAVGAVLATAGIGIGGAHLVGGEPANEAPVAGAPPLAAEIKTPTATTSSNAQATPTNTLQTLKRLLPADLRVSQPQMWGDNFIAVSVVVDDGKGASHLEASVQTVKYDMSCANEPPTTNCRVRPDGSIITSYQAKAGKSDDPDVIFNSVIVHRPDRSVIHLSSVNSPAMKAARHTRPQPAFSIAELTRMADSKLWNVPPTSYGKDLGR